MTQLIAIRTQADIKDILSHQQCAKEARKSLLWRLNDMLQAAERYDAAGDEFHKKACLESAQSYCDAANALRGE